MSVGDKWVMNRGARRGRVQAGNGVLTGFVDWECWVYGAADAKAFSPAWMGGFRKV